MFKRRRLAVPLVATAVVAGVVPLLVSSPASSAPGVAACPAEPSYAYTIPAPLGPPTAISLSNGTVGFAALGADSGLYYDEQLITDPPLVSPLACFGGRATDAPGIVQTGDSARAMFVRVSDGRIYQKYVGENYNTLAASWTAIPAARTTDGPAALVDPDGGLHLFVRGTNGALYHGWLTGGTWRWESLGGMISGSPTAILDGSDVLVAATTPTGYVYTRRGFTGAWGPYTRVSIPVAGTDPAVPMTTRTTPALTTGNVAGRIDMFVVSPQYGLVETSRLTNAQFMVAGRIDSQPLPFDARIAAGEDGEGNSIVFASFLDRAAGHRLTAYTEFLTSAGVWSDYSLAPFSCPACAPDVLTLTRAGRGALAKAQRTARTHLSRAAKMPVHTPAA